MTYRANIEDLTPVVALVKIWLALAPIFVIVAQRLHDIDLAIVQNPDLLLIFVVVVRKFWIRVESARGAAQLACDFGDLFGRTSAREWRQREVKVALAGAS